MKALCWECSWNVDTDDPALFDHMSNQHTVRYGHELKVEA